MDNAITKRSTIDIKKYDRIVYVIIFLISVLIIIRDVQTISISKYIYIILAGIAFFIGSKSHIYCIMGFITPLCSGISYTYLSLIAIIALLFKQGDKRVSVVGLSCIALLSFLEFLSFTQGNFMFGTYIRFLGVFLVAYGRMIDLDNDYDDQKILNNFLIGMIVALVSVWGQMLKSYSFSSILTMGNMSLRFGNTREALDIATDGMRISYNPNGLGYLCVIAALISLVLLRKNNNKLYYVLFFIFSLQGIMTGSRAFIIAYPISVVAYLLTQNKARKINIRAIFAVTASIVVLIFLLNRFVSTYVDALIRRFEVNDISNGRNELFSYYFQKWFQSVYRMILGSGLQDYPNKYNAFNSAHNSIQEILITWGVLGLIIVELLIATILKTARGKNPKIKAFQYVPFFAYIFLTMSGQGFSDASGMLRLMVTYSALMLEFDDDIQAGEEIYPIKA